MPAPRGTRPVQRTIVRETIEEGDPHGFVGSLGGGHGDVLDADYVAGVDEAKDKLLDFIEAVNVKAEDGDVVFQLSQLGMGTSSPIAVWTFSIGGDVQEMADLIVDRAVEDGSAVGRGTCKYCVTIEGKKGRKSFSLRFPDRDDDDIDEPPNERGAFAQLMRQNEQLHRSILGVVQQMVMGNKDTIKEMREDLKSARATQIEGVKVLGELYQAQHERQLEVKRLEKAETRKDELLDQAMTLAQVVANKFMGPEVFKGKDGQRTPIEQLGYRLLSSFTPAQWSDVQKGVIKPSPTQTIALLELASALQEQDQAFEAAQGGQQQQQTQPTPPTPTNGAPSKGGTS